MTNSEFKKMVGNKIFSVTFVKADKTLRTYNARVDVKKHTKGGVNTVEHKPNLVTVWELTAKQYRTLNLDTIKQLKFAGAEYNY